MSQAAIIGVVVLMMMSSSSSLAILVMGGDDDKKTTGPSSPGPSSPGPSRSPGPSSTPTPSSFSYIGDGECHNDVLKTGNICRATEGCDYIGQQSNGCWHLLKSGGTGKIPSDYPNALNAISPVSRKYDFVAGGPCIGTEQYRSVADTCKTTSGCDTIGQQSNGCWHFLKANSAGATPISNYPRSIMPSNL
jgi:hypothetical protein